MQRCKRGGLFHLFAQERTCSLCDIHVLNSTSSLALSSLLLRENDVVMFKVVPKSENFNANFQVHSDRLCSSIPDLIILENENEAIAWKTHSVQSTSDFAMVKFIPAYTGTYTFEANAKTVYVKHSSTSCFKYGGPAAYHAGEFYLYKGKEYFINLEEQMFSYGYKGFDWENVERNLDITLTSLDQLSDDYTFKVPSSIPGRKFFSWDPENIVVRWNVAKISTKVSNVALAILSKDGSDVLQPGDVFVMSKTDIARFFSFFSNDFPPLGTPDALFVSNGFSDSDTTFSSVERAFMRGQYRKNPTIYVCPGFYPLPRQNSAYTFRNAKIVAKYAKFSDNAFWFRNSKVQLDGLQFQDSENAMFIESEHSVVTMTNCSFTRIPNAIRAEGISSLTLESVNFSESVSLGIQSRGTKSVRISNVDNGSLFQIQSSEHVEIDRSNYLALTVEYTRSVVVDRSLFKNSKIGARMRSVGNVTFRDCLFEANGKKSEETNGGGLLVEQSNNVTLIDCKFKSNTVSGSGGAIYFLELIVAVLILISIVVLITIYVKRKRKREEKTRIEDEVQMEEIEQSNAVAVLEEDDLESENIVEDFEENAREEKEDERLI